MDTAVGHCLFDTVFGRAGVAWSDQGITSVQLFEGSDERTVARLRARGSARLPPPPVADAIERLQRHLEHGREDLTGIALDQRSVPPFYKRVYDQSRLVGAGRVVSYGELALELGSATLSRAVGTAMAKNPFMVVVPCHRVTGANGASGGFSAHGGLRSKARLLAREGAPLTGELRSLIVRIGDVGFDPAEAVAALSSRDPVMGALIAKVGAFNLTRSVASSTYESLARAVVYQQLSGKAAATIYGRLAALGGGEACPDPATLMGLSVAALRGAGLSAAKVAALHDLAAKTLAGEVPSLAEMEEMDEEEIITRLTAVRGIGRWSAEMLLMFTLGRPNVLPVGDFGVRNGARLAYGMKELPSPEALTKRGERWKPWRTVASWYLWRAVDLFRGDATLKGDPGASGVT